MLQFLVFYILVALLTSVAILLLLNLIRVLRQLPTKWFGFSFLVLNYHLFILPLVVPVLLWPIIFGDITPLYLFAAYALAGIFGEAAFAIFWDAFVDKRFWVYAVDTFTSKAYSSWLNFIPWGMGGVVYLGAADAISYQPDLSEIATFWLVFFGALAIIALVRLAAYLLLPKVTSFEFKTVTIPVYFYVMTPILAAIAATWYIHADVSVLYAAALFALASFSAEYLFGKMCVLFVSKRLWTYAYMSYDNCHLTPLSLIPFALGGFFFLTVHHFALLFF